MDPLFPRVSGHFAPAQRTEACLLAGEGAC